MLVRTRPTAVFSHDQIGIDSSKGTIVINKRLEGGDKRKESWDFKFDRVLHNTGQEAMYEEAAESVVNGCIDGKNGTIMAYGQTGAGKTFTMTGETDNYKQRGITPRAIAQVFAEIKERPHQVFKVSISYMEIYNERIFDLLGDSETDLSIAEDTQTHSMIVRGLTMEVIESEEDALKLLFRGDRNRITAEHQLNKQSNRSHSIFTVHIEQQSRVRSEQITRSKLNLVDLAGSERLKKAIGERLEDTLVKESRYINKSLTYLEQVVVALTARNRTHIPYRQTKLTNVLKDSLGGNCSTVLVACIWGERAHLEESISTLKLAQRMTHVENHSTSNLMVDPSMLIKRYERQIRDLKQELVMHDAIANRSGVNYEEYTPEESRELAEQVREYVEASPGEEALQVVSVRQIEECFRQFKLLVQNAQATAEERLRREFSALIPESKEFENESKPSLEEMNKSSMGELEYSGGLSLGVAPTGAKPPNGIEDEEVQVLDKEPSAILSPVVVLTRQVAFTKFLEESNEKKDLDQAKMELRSIAQEMQSIRKRLLSTQSEMDENQRKVNAIRSEQKNEMKTDVIDEEEYLCLKSIKELKKEFRPLREKYDALSLKKKFTSESIGAMETNLLQKFQNWFTNFRVTDESKIEDQLDDGEKFDLLEIERISSHDPESVAFFKASKQQREIARKYKGNAKTKRN